MVERSLLAPGFACVEERLRYAYTVHPVAQAGNGPHAFPSAQPVLAKLAAAQCTRITAPRTIFQDPGS